MIAFASSRNNAATPAAASAPATTATAVVRTPVRHHRHVYEDLLIGSVAASIAQSLIAPLHMIKLLISNQVIIHHLSLHSRIG